MSKNLIFVSTIHERFLQSIFLQKCLKARYLYAKKLERFTQPDSLACEEKVAWHIVGLVVGEREYNGEPSYDLPSIHLQHFTYLPQIAPTLKYYTSHFRAELRYHPPTTYAP